MKILTRASVLLVAAAAAVMVAGCSVTQAPAVAETTPATTPAATTAATSSAPTSAAAGATQAPASGTSTSPKVLVIIDENHTAAQVRDGMPYLTSLSARYAHATNDQGISHPSLPNYLAMAGGSTFGISNDAPPSAWPIAGVSVFGSALAHGRTAHVYADGSPGTCALSDNDATGYAVRHGGWPYFVTERAQCSTNMTGLDPLPGDITAGRLPNVGWLVPSGQHNAHSPSTLADADAFLSTWVPRIMAGPDYRSGHLSIVVTFDEGTHSDNTIALVVINPALSQKVVSEPLSQYSLSRWLFRVGGGQPQSSAAGATDTGTAFGL